MINRRTFIKSVAAAGTAVALSPLDRLSKFAYAAAPGFAVHPFVESHPDAVFILRTSVGVKTDSDAIRAAGLSFGRSVILAKDVADGGIPLTNRVVIKPNLTCRGVGDPQYTIERSMGIVTDSNFVEGIIESMKELGMAGSQFFIREVNCFSQFADGGYIAMADRTGADIRDLSAPVGVLAPEFIQWKDVPDGVWFNSIPYLWPTNAPGSWLLNIAKFKAHGMGLTLCAKNLQGTIAANFQQHCTPYNSNMNIDPQYIRTDAKVRVMENYLRHMAEGIPRWDRPENGGGGWDNYGGLWMETWATRCLDNNSVTSAGLHIIEGVYGRDGDFLRGPSPEGLATDYMSNVVIFGKNQFYVDMIGHYLGGHEPGNFGLFHMARERAMISHINPRLIPLYEWHTDGTATMTPLSAFTRTPLKTYYLRRNYNGQNEEYWHLVNESYDYGPGIDVSSRVKVSQSGFGRNRATGIWSATMTVKNTGGSSITGPIQVVLTNLSLNATMTNNSGMFNGSPYITVSNGSLLPGGQAGKQILFTNPSNDFINYLPATYSGGLSL